MKDSSSAKEEELATLRERIASAAYTRLFAGKVLENHFEHKLFIKDEIQKLKKRPVTRTVQLFAADSLNPTNFHSYVDEVPDIMLVVKTESGLYLGGFSECPVSSTSIADKGGLIMSLTSKMVFPVVEGKRSVNYDKFFLIFGNSEIRLRQGEFKVFSNFGIGSGFYKSTGATVNDLIGAGKEREVKIEGYEIYRVLFE